MIGAFAWSFGEWWPLLAFAWLAVGKLAWVRNSAPVSDDDTMLQMAAWAGSVVAYLFACFATVVPPVPRLGMKAELQAQFGFGEGQGGLWIEEPQRVVAMGALYFGLLCAAKLLAARWSRLWKTRAHVSRSGNRGLKHRKAQGEREGSRWVSEGEVRILRRWVQLFRLRPARLLRRIHDPRQPVAVVRADRELLAGARADAATDAP